MDIYIHNTPAPDENWGEGIVRTISNNGALRSSARTLRCSVKSGNERNPCCQLQVSGETAGVSRRKEGITSNQHGLDARGYTRATMGNTMGRQPARGSQSHQNFPQFRLRAATCPHEEGIASNRGSACRGEYVLESCTHRPSYQGSRENPKPPALRGFKVSSVTRVKS